MRVFVTGGTGFTGGHLVQRLVKDGHEVGVLARRTSNTESLKKLGVEIITGDITDRDLVTKAVSGFDMVYHIAAMYREGGGIAEKPFWDVNVDGTKNMLEASINANVGRFIHCSTAGVHGHVSNPPADENHPYNPGDIYQKTKIEGEKLALDYFAKGLPGVVVRPVGIYGPGDLRFLKLFKSIQTGNFVMIGDGKVLYHLTYIDDLVEGFMLCGKKDNALGQTYIIAGDRYTSLNELVETIASSLGVKKPKIHFPFFWPVWTASLLCEAVCYPLRINPPIFRRRVDIFRKDRAFDISKARKELGYEPKVGLGEGIKKTADWYKKEGHIS
ncbi:nucleoside-diphosphate-sugar epimerase [Candidatus Methanoperedens nitroreducens]|uniref:Nucleoside-diphosphate-sugar epimerase n=1 Tax=Candidatus Methanoperedens nitratireducens TaxID=1392998 RepID=A0A062VAD8_9EURY|nr:NAD-dependent epimerase/dehydratase family protein [Candidatus Methanoperedens nitroreducens]KCZ72305.1 nucleoside-diphosphate-sugar epimerase [Candidatus Methanoperedens nitroreducens]MDJ1420769.1 NAD-dependent epimerase/dehydratase family protein [Candidatus Methanoperedens sp.]